MAKSKPSITPLHQLQPFLPSETFALLSEKSQGTTRDGKPYFACTFRDKVRSLAARVWQDSPCFDEAHSWHVGDFMRIRGVYTEHEKYGAQINLQQVFAVTEADRADGFKESDFYDLSRFDPALMFDELRKLVEAQIVEEPLRKLVLLLLDTHVETLKLLPAHRDKFFPFPGGWLEHILGVTKNCIYLVDYYRAHYPELKPPLNRGLVIAGAVLHDIGRVAEFMPIVPGHKIERTIPGELFTHTMLGRDMIREAAREIKDFDAELLMLLEHIVMTHLELPAWGSQRLPAIPEVLILHHADDLDAKLEMYIRCLTRDAADGPFTDRDPSLNKPLLKQRKV